MIKYIDRADVLFARNLISMFSVHSRILTATFGGSCNVSKKQIVPLIKNDSKISLEIETLIDIIDNLTIIGNKCLD